MLVLERKSQKKVRIHAPNGDELIVQFIRSKEGKGVLGFEFPKGYKILREELETLEDPKDPPAKAA